MKLLRRADFPHPHDPKTRIFSTIIAGLFRSDFKSDSVTTMPRPPAPPTCSWSSISLSRMDVVSAGSRVSARCHRSTHSDSESSPLFRVLPRKSSLVRGHCSALLTPTPSPLKMARTASRLSRRTREWEAALAYKDLTNLTPCRPQREREREGHAHGALTPKRGQWHHSRVWRLLSVAASLDVVRPVATVDIRKDSKATSFVRALHFLGRFGPLATGEDAITS